MNYFLYFLFNSFDLFFLSLYMNGVYGPRKKYKGAFRVLSLLLVFFTTLSMHPDKAYFNLIAITVMSFFLLGFYPGGWKNKMLFSIMAFVIANLWGTIIYMIIRLMPLSAIYVDTISLWIGHIGFGLLLLAARRMIQTQSGELPGSFWLILFSIPAMSALSYFCMMYLLMILPAIKTRVTISFLILLGTILMINGIVFYLFRRYAVLNRKAVEKELLEQQMVLQQEYYRRLEEEQQTVRSIRHDMKNTLDTLNLLLNRGQIKEAAGLLGGARLAMDQASAVFSTGNAPIDTILNLKKEEACRKGIAFDIESAIPPHLPLSFEQAVILFGNLCDNAIEAVSRLPEQQRKIKLKMGYSGYSLYLGFSNPAPAAGAARSCLNISSPFHGLGLKNVRKIVDQFDGTMEIENKEAVFSVKIILYLNDQF